jgi:hypothetical protein
MVKNVHLDPALQYLRNMQDSDGPTIADARYTNLECSQAIDTTLLLTALVQSRVRLSWFAIEVMSLMSFGHNVLKEFTSIAFSARG